MAMLQIPNYGWDVVGGRLDWQSNTILQWTFQNNNQLRLYDGTNWTIVGCSSMPTFNAASSLDLSGSVLLPNMIYDVFAEYSSSTAFTLSMSRWAYGGNGGNSTNSSYSLTTYAGSTPVMTSATTPGPYAITTDNEAGSSAYKAFTQGASAGDYWGATSTIGAGHYLIVDFGVGNSVVVNKYNIKARNTGYNANCWPRDFSLYGSNDGTNWSAALDSRTNTSSPGANTFLASYLTFNNKTPYRYYKLLVTANASGNETNIGELKLVVDSKSIGGGSARVSPWEISMPYIVGNRVTNGGHDYVCIAPHTSHSSTFSSDSLSWVDNGTSVTGDFAGLYRHDGVLVSDSSATGKKRRWLGIIMTYNNGGTVNFKDDINYRYVSNFYNGKMLTSQVTFSGDTTTSNTSWAEVTTAIRAYFLSCKTQQISIALSFNGSVNNTGASANAGVALSSSSTRLFYTNTNVAVSSYAVSVNTVGTTSFMGYQFLTMLAVPSSNTLTINTGQGMGIVTSFLG
jgi:hypothetical protein